MEVSLTFGAFNWVQAVDIANNYRGGGYSDWRLPTRSELNNIYINLRLQNLAGLGNDIYWTSSNYGTADAYYQNFSNGRQSLENQDVGYKVRAVRVF